MTSPLHHDNSWMESVKAEKARVFLEFSASAGEGFDKLIDERFNTVTKDPTVTWGARNTIEGPIINELIHQELIGSRYAPHGRKVLGQIRLLRADMQGPLDALRLLRQSKETKSFAKGARHFRANGPLNVVRAEALAVIHRRPLSWWRDVDIEAMAQGGDLLGSSDAARGFEALSQAMRNSSKDTDVRFGMDRRMAALGTLSRTAGRDEDLCTLVLQLVTQGPQEQILMNAYAVGLRYVEWEKVTLGTQSAWRHWLEKGPTGVDHSAVRLTVAAAVGLPDTVDRGGTGLTAIAAELNSAASSDALSPISHVRAVEMAESLIEAMTGIREKASRGGYGFGGLSPADLAVTLLAHNGGISDLWEAVIGYVTDPNIPRELKADAVDRLARLSKEIPNESLSELSLGVDGLFASQNLHLPNSGGSDVFAPALRLAALTGIRGEASLLSDLVRLTSDPAPAVRVEAARTLDAMAGNAACLFSWAHALLVQLCRDRDATVRANAGHGLARAAAPQNELRSLWEELLVELLGEDGVIVPLFTVRGVEEAWSRGDMPVPAVVRSIEERAENSMSLGVREACAAALVLLAKRTPAQDDS
ncbi:HEAT repeat domain-containing protein [Janibacter cremeus]|uniref:HEAT repeat domain-containing protein n=1 Tax=Janibacter cremeus TaxID=1285192 RepID=UPI0023F9D131|nr:HEAT repeat domain-containing protein [Janibacter cremeus]WEV77215.1 HEAT repeat domain-containing protein [Janibacter cremeus]